MSPLMHLPGRPCTRLDALKPRAGHLGPAIRLHGCSFSAQPRPTRPRIRSGDFRSEDRDGAIEHEPRTPEPGKSEQVQQHSESRGLERETGRCTTPVVGRVDGQTDQLRQHLGFGLWRSYRLLHIERRARSPVADRIIGRRDGGGKKAACQLERGNNIGNMVQTEIGPDSDRTKEECKIRFVVRPKNCEPIPDHDVVIVVAGCHGREACPSRIGVAKSRACFVSSRTRSTHGKFARRLNDQRMFRAWER